MSEEARMWMEISFNIVYLLVVWSVALAMWRRRAIVAEEERPLANLFMWAFFLLALGDTGHVGFRVWAYALGGLENTISVFGMELGLVGLGALATSITVTFFYILVLFIWQKRFDKPLGGFGYLLLTAAIVRLLIHIFPQNEWNNVVPPQPWSLYRNLPLMVQGLGVAFLILRDALSAKDRAYIWVGIMILTSYAFYTPVILLVQKMPLIGMLMIPKTLAYVAIAFIGYFAYYRHAARHLRPPATQSGTLSPGN